MINSNMNIMKYKNEKSINNFIYLWECIVKYLIP